MLEMRGLAFEFFFIGFAFIKISHRIMKTMKQRHLLEVRHGRKRSENIFKPI